MDKQKQIKEIPNFMFYRERKKLAEEYEEWVNTPLEDGSKIKDCALSVITFMQIKGFCKIPEGARVFIPTEEKYVILTQEEYKNYLAMKSIERNACKHALKDELGDLYCGNDKSENLGDFCVVCGEYVPEGRQVCPNCEKQGGKK